MRFELFFSRTFRVPMKAEDVIQEARDTAASPYARFRKSLPEGRKPMGYACPFIPEELIHAAGMLPLRVYGRSADLGGADRYLPSQCCEVARAMVSSVAGGELRFLESMVFGFCCDTIRAAAGTLQARPGFETFFLNIPTRLNGPGVRDYLVREIAAFGTSMAVRLDLKPDPEKLRSSICVYRENDALLHQLRRLRLEKPRALSGSDYVALTVMGQVMPKEEHNERLSVLLEAFRSGKEFNETGGGKRVLVAGLLNGNVEYLRRLESLGLDIVDDDLCEASRSLAEETPAETDPLYSVADRILSRYCPVKIKDGLDSATLWAEKCSRSGAEAVVVFLFRFCDPQYMEYATGKPGLKERGIPCAVVEVGLDGMGGGQADTRLEAFIESLGSQ